MRITHLLLIKYVPHSELAKLKKNVLSSLSYLEGLTQYLSGRHFRLKGLQKEVQVPHLGMWSSAMENVKGEKENFK